MDPRLAYDANIFNGLFCRRLFFLLWPSRRISELGTLKLDSSRIWTPDVYVANLVTPSGLQTIKELPATIVSDGTVRAVFRSVGEYTCEMDIGAYPYDRHACFFDVSVAATVDEVRLEGSLGFDVDDGPEGFEEPEPEGVLHYAESADTKGFESSRVSYELEFRRDPGYVVATYVLVGWAFNMVGFLVPQPRRPADDRPAPLSRDLPRPLSL